MPPQSENKGETAVGGQTDEAGHFVTSSEQKAVENILTLRGGDAERDRHVAVRQRLSCFRGNIEIYYSRFLGTSTAPFL